MRLSCAAALLAWAGTAAAQTPPPHASDSTGPTCWRGRPLAHCESFWITDFTYGTRLNAVEEPGGGKVKGDYLTWEFGGMVNQGPRHAFGAAMIKSFGHERSYFGVRPRYRRWLNSETSLDVSVGILVSGDHDRFRPRFPSFTTHVALSHGDLAGVIVGAEVIRGRPGGADLTWQAGVRFGSYAGPPAGVLIMLKILHDELGGGGT
ncbi:MAG TPA: hypothetical protein VGQ06_07125 [Gemmatimonadales bacterium]|jgi:hypothetical protein|nr:hypothetical protein [Gemmatimonadales bacterium]